MIVAIPSAFDTKVSGAEPREMIRHASTQSAVQIATANSGD
jgi:hypothetical protein